MHRRNTKLYDSYGKTLGKTIIFIRVIVHEKQFFIKEDKIVTLNSKTSKRASFLRGKFRVFLVKVVGIKLNKRKKKKN